MNLYEKLIEIRKEVPYLKKNNKGYNFDFVSSSQTLGSLRSKMDELGVLLIPRVEKWEIRDHTTAKGKHEYFTILNMVFTWLNAEKPEETISCPWIGQGLDDGEKGVGKALTYSEKYFMLKFFNIATDRDDPDSFQGKHPAIKQKNPLEIKGKIETTTIIVADVTRRVGENNGKAWEKYGIVADGGAVYGTFSKTIKEIATNLLGQPATISFEKEGKFLTCVKIESSV